jgi:hypothetical protein
MIAARISHMISEGGDDNLTCPLVLTAFARSIHSTAAPGTDGLNKGSQSSLRAGSLRAGAVDAVQEVKCVE